jgi:plastocyanin
MRKLLVAALVAALSALAVAFATQALAATRTVRIGDDYYVRKGSPPTVTVAKGTRVRWRWVGDEMHNVVVTKGPVKFRSSLKDSGTYSRTMRRTGTYKIHCTIHQPDMRMTLKVVR